MFPRASLDAAKRKITAPARNKLVIQSVASQTIDSVIPVKVTVLKMCTLGH
jgi:hypothetical protein